MRSRPRRASAPACSRTGFRRRNDARGACALRAQDGLEAFAALAAHQLGEAIALMRGAAAVLEAAARHDGQRRAGCAAGAQRRRRPRPALRRRPARRRARGRRARGAGALGAARLGVRRRRRRARELPDAACRCTCSASRCRARRSSRARPSASSSTCCAARWPPAPRASGVTGHAVGDAVVVELFDNGTPAREPPRPVRALRPPARAGRARRRRREPVGLPPDRRAPRRSHRHAGPRRRRDHRHRRAAGGARRP